MMSAVIHALDWEKYETPNGFLMLRIPLKHRGFVAWPITIGVSLPSATLAMKAMVTLSLAFLPPLH